MIKKLKLKFSIEENKRLLSNFFSLSILQGANYILPFLTFPYLVSVLGIEKFGLLAFATSFIMFFQIFTDYGFNLTATRQVSINRDNQKKINEIFNAVLFIKLGLIFISFIILLIFINIFDKFHQDYVIYLFTFGTVIGNALFPIWFFQGIENMKFITYLNIFSKSIFTISIFIFITTAEDYIYVPLINSLGFLISGIVSMIIVYKKFGINIKLPNKKIMKFYLIDGFSIFLSNIFISIYSYVPILFLGFFTNNNMVGVYSIIEKTVAIFNGLFAPVSQTLFPYVSKKIHQDKLKAIGLIRRILKGYVLVALLLILLINIFSFELLSLISKDKTLATQYSFLLQIFSVSILISRIGDIFGTFTLIGFGENKVFSIVMLRGSILSTIIVFVLINLYEITGAVISYLISIGIIVLMLYFKSNKLNLKIKGEKVNG